MSAWNAGDLGLIPELGRSAGEGNGNPLQYSCLENSHGQRSLAGYSSWGHKESDMTEWLTLYFRAHRNKTVYLGMPWLPPGNCKKVLASTFLLFLVFCLKIKPRFWCFSCDPVWQQWLQSIPLSIINLVFLCSPVSPPVAALDWPSHKSTPKTVWTPLIASN